MSEPQRLIGDYVLIEDDLVADGAIDLGADGRIVAAGPTDSLAETSAPTHRIGGLLMPGLVNSHAHTPMTLMRSAGDGMPLQQWLTEAVWPREGKMTSEDAYWGMLLGSAEMLRAGVTTTCEMYFHEEAVLSATEMTGQRLVTTPAILPSLGGGPSVSDRIDSITEFFHKHHDPDGRVTVGFGPHALYTLSPDDLKAIGRRAQELDTIVQVHLEETQHERTQVIDMWTGQTATEILSEVGVLDGQVLAAHGVWLSESDQALLGDAGAAVAHCPVSNLKLGSGIAPVTSMIEHGITVGLGTDGVASNDNLDLWQELRLAPMLARGRELDAQAMSASEALALATVNSAKATGLADVGLLKPGYKADVIRLDLDQPEFTPGLKSELLANVVFAGGSQHVTDVWVGGVHVIAAKQCNTIDLKHSLTEVRTRGQRIAE